MNESSDAASDAADTTLLERLGSFSTSTLPSLPSLLSLLLLLVASSIGDILLLDTVVDFTSSMTRILLSFWSTSPSLPWSWNADATLVVDLVDEPGVISLFLSLFTLFRGEKPSILGDGVLK